MYPESARRVTLYDGLRRIDEDLASEAKDRGCPRCRAPLDWATWQRKPRGLDLPEAMCVRLGLCCRDCRRRVLPPSTLFWGRRVYWGAIKLVCVVVQQRRLVGWSAVELRKLFGVAKETLKRWLAFFAGPASEAENWQVLRGRVPPSVRNEGLPGPLLALFDQTVGAGEAALNAFLSFWVGRGIPGF